MKKITYFCAETGETNRIFVDLAEFSELGCNWIAETSGDPFTDCDSDVAAVEEIEALLKGAAMEECDDEDHAYVRGCIEAWGLAAPGGCKSYVDLQTATAEDVPVISYCSCIDCPLAADCLYGVRGYRKQLQIKERPGHTEGQKFLFLSLDQMRRAIPPMAERKAGLPKYQASRFVRADGNIADGSSNGVIEYGYHCQADGQELQGVFHIGFSEIVNGQNPDFVACELMLLQDAELSGLHDIVIEFERYGGDGYTGNSVMLEDKSRLQ